MHNGLALILGANLGTTATSWLVAVVGFELKLDALALPLLGMTGIAYFLFKKESAPARWLMLLLGFGLMFTGLWFIKTGMDGLVHQVNLAAWSGSHPLVFLLAGFLLTTLIQASSATMAITLSVLATGALTLTDTMAVALGSEVGTTMKVVLAALGGSADKKRVALGNFLFNLLSTILFMFLLRPAEHLIVHLWQVRHSTIALVVFQSLVNLGGIVLFLPFLKPISRWLSRRFTSGMRTALFLPNAADADAELGLEAARQEVLSLMQHTLDFSNHVFGWHQPPASPQHTHQGFAEMPPLEQYVFVKTQHGEIFDFLMKLQTANGSIAVPLATERLLSAARNTIYAAKSIKDAMGDVQDFRESGKEFKYQFFERNQKQASSYTRQLEKTLFNHPRAPAEMLMQLFVSVQQQYRDNMGYIYQSIVNTGLSEVELSSVMNLNRELTSAYKSLTLAAKDLLLTAEQAAPFEEMPGFIR
jgi:phosphate:Na+ symporter